MNTEASTLSVAGQDYRIHRLNAVPGSQRLPYALKVVLENLLRYHSAGLVTADQVAVIAQWDPAAEPNAEVQFRPARVLLHDTTGVPAVVDLAAMRDAVREAGGDPRAVNPNIPVHLVTDHSLSVEVFGRPDAMRRNIDIEYRRNHERYRLLRWAEEVFADFSVVPPGSGIMHQINLEYLSSLVEVRDGVAFPDTLVGADSHTTMVNGLGVLGWGVGGIEAEAAMLGEPLSMLAPRVLGVRLSGSLREGVTATDLVLTLTEKLRGVGVVASFVEFFGPGVGQVSLATRATIANMSPEYGSTCAVFPIDQVTLNYLTMVGRAPARVALIESYAKEQGLWHNPLDTPDYSATIDFDLDAVEPSLAGPSRPQDRVSLRNVPASLQGALDERHRTPGQTVSIALGDNGPHDLRDGAVAIAAITSCTNTSNPNVMVAAGLLAKNAVERGLSVKPWVKTSLAPGSKVVMSYLEQAGLIPALDRLGFGLVGFGCTTCIGNSGPLIPEVSAAVRDTGLVAAAVLSGNRNFGGRINPDVELSYLASPPLVVAYALAGNVDLDITTDPLGFDQDGHPVRLADIWPTDAAVEEVVAQIGSAMFTEAYKDLFIGDEQWRSVSGQTGVTFEWDPDSTYVRRPPFFPSPGALPLVQADIRGARVLALLGDSVTTDHLSPSGVVTGDSPAGHFLAEHNVPRPDFNSYPSRRGNFEVMARATLANTRVQNQLAPGTRGSATVHLPDGEPMSVYEAAVRYAHEGTPLLIVAGKDYGNGSSRDWAAKGPRLLGVRAVIAESFEPIHRSNLVGMGILPLQFEEGDSAQSLGLTGYETYEILGLTGAAIVPSALIVRADETTFPVRVRVDTPTEQQYIAAGGLLPHILASFV